MYILYDKKLHFLLRKVSRFGGARRCANCVSY